MLKKTLKGLAIGAGLTAMLAGPASAQRGVSDTEIVIGTHTPLSGTVAVWGVPSTQAMRLVFDKANAEGGIHGRKIKYIVEDSQYQVPRAVQAGNKLINRDKIFAMVGALGTPMNNAVMRMQLAKKVPNMYPFTAARSMSEPLHPMKFGFAATYYDQIHAAVNYFVTQKGKKKVCSAYQDTDFGQEILDGTQDALKTLGMDLAAKVPHKPTETEFVASVTALKNAGCDVVTMGTIVADTIKLYATARGMGFDADFVGSFASYDDLVATMAKGATEGYYAATSGPIAYKDSVNGEAKEFFDAYEAAYGKSPTGAAQAGYNAAKLIVEGLRQAGKDLSTEGFIEGTERIKGFKDVFGGADLSFSKTQHNGRDNVLLAVIKDGRWVTAVENMVEK